MNYNEAKIHQLTAAGTYRVYGHPADFDRDDERTTMKDWTPVRPCYCVQDSFENPCACPKRNMWWLQEDAIVAKGTSDRKDEDGDKLHYFDVRINSTILVESVRPMSADAMQKLGPRALVAAADGFSAPETMAEGVGEHVLYYLFDKALNLVWDNLTGPSLGDLIEEWKKQHQMPPPR